MVLMAGHAQEAQRLEWRCTHPADAGYLHGRRAGRYIFDSYSSQASSCRFEGRHPYACSCSPKDAPSIAGSDRQQAWPFRHRGGGCRCEAPTPSALAFMSMHLLLAAPGSRESSLQDSGSHAAQMMPNNVGCSCWWSIGMYKTAHVADLLL